MSLLNKKPEEDKKVNNTPQETKQEPKPVEEKKQEEFIYSCPYSATLTIQLSSGDVKAKNGVLKVNASQHKEIKDLIASGRPDIAQNAILLDIKAAEEIAKRDIEVRKAAARGVHSTTTVAERLIEARDPQNMSPGEHIRNLDVIEAEAVHAEDSALDPNKGQ